MGVPLCISRTHSATARRWAPVGAKGKRAKKWVYEVKNYPNYAADSGCIRATLLVYDGLVIGGDVSSLELNGFSQGFEFPDEQLNATTAKQ